MVKMERIKEPVRLRQKKLANGNLSLYLDIYRNGMRSYEFLRLYLIPETDKNAKLRNKETLRLAEAIKIEHIAELQKNTFGFSVTKTKTRLTQYIRDYMAQKDKGTSGTYRNVLIRAEDYFGDSFILERITENDVKEFFAYIAKTPNHNKNGKLLSQTTVNLYCSIFRTFLNQAAREGIVPYNFAKTITIVKKAESVRQYLTIDELQRLTKTNLTKTYRRAFIFSCLTGLRKSDIERLTWGDIVEQDDFTRIIFRQKKTHNLEYLDISEQARQILGERKAATDSVFPKFHPTHKTNKSIRKWAQSIGIDKPLTFHSARHTFACMMLTVGVDLYTTSKLLGHRNLGTTQIYAKIVDKKKQEAVSKIPIEI